MSALSTQPFVPATPRRRRHLSVVPDPVPSPRRDVDVPAGSRPRLRVTRRGRLVATLGTGAVLLCGGAAAASAAASGAPEPVPGTVQVAVLPGESLWSIAERLAGPGEDVRDVVVAISEMNDLASPRLAAGQHLEVPARAA